MFDLGVNTLKKIGNFLKSNEQILPSDAVNSFDTFVRRCESILSVKVIHKKKEFNEKNNNKKKYF